VLFFIELSTRRVQVAGISAAANGLWINQIARNLTDSVDGLLTDKLKVVATIIDPDASGYAAMRS
jgi:hypothetical protein